jgi:hypothetical protein
VQAGLQQKFEQYEPPHYDDIRSLQIEKQGKSRDQVKSGEAKRLGVPLKWYKQEYLGPQAQALRLHDNLNEATKQFHREVTILLGQAQAQNRAPGKPTWDFVQAGLQQKYPDYQPINYTTVSKPQNGSSTTKASPPQ